MDYEFPNPDEEYDLLHEDEYELLREIEEFENKQQSTQPQKVDPKKQNNRETTKAAFNTPTLTQSLQSKKDESTKEKEKRTSEASPKTSAAEQLNVFSLPGTIKSNEYNNSEVDSTKKRTYEDLFGDISDVVDIDDFVDTHGHREKKPRWDEPTEVIKMVLDAREKFQDLNRGMSAKRKHCEDEKKNSISLRVPTWNFIAVTRPHDAQRIYVRVRNEKYCFEKSTNSISNLLTVPYSQLKAEAEEIIVKNVERASCAISNPPVNKKLNEDELWVEKYRPRSYVDLLSDESVNRDLLHWIKLWDKVVFNRNFIQSKKKKAYSMFGKKKFEKEDVVEEIDSKGLPIQRVVLLSGPPGLGKTTLAHLAAKHAGYNVVEINASDERSPEAFRQVLLSSTQMKAVMGNDPRPNCVILDEIDGAPAASIDLLLKFVQGKLVAKGKKEKAKSGKQANSCHRPVICICNEPYTPSLRPLRAAALLIPVPEVSPIRLADRLMEVARKEKLKVNPDALLQLAEISGCDVRSCLGALQYMGGVKLGDNLSFALKDSRKGLFDSWKQILTIPMNRSGLIPTPERVRLILKTVQNGESDKLAQGVFHNYPDVCGDKLYYVTTCLEWFQFFDEISSLIARLQVWSIMPYTNYAFVTWHLYFAKSRNIKLSYPSITYEVHQKLSNSTGILTAIQRCSGRNIVTLAVDFAPFLPDLLSPRLRTVSGHLHSSKERADIVRLVDILLEFGLTFVQEKSFDGSYEYKLDPNIFEVGVFSECKVRRMLAHAVIQIIVQELEAERLRRAAKVTGITGHAVENETDNASKENKKAKSPEPKNDKKTQNDTTNVPKSLEESIKIVPPVKEIIYKDFFGRPITINQNKQTSDKESTNVRNLLTKHGVWYKYKEGFSNAVRRTVLMQELL